MKRERVVISGPDSVHVGLTLNDRLKAVHSLSSRFLATNASEFLNEERELSSQVPFTFTLALLSTKDLMPLSQVPFTLALLSTINLKL